jgi:hypothetical protein
MSDDDMPTIAGAKADREWAGLIQMTADEIGASDELSAFSCALSRR